MNGPEDTQGDGPTMRAARPSPPEAGPLKIKVETTGDISVLSLAGKMTLGDGDRLLREALEMLLASGQERVILDMLDVGMLDSAGLGEVVACSRRVTKGGGDLKLVLRGKILDLFRMTRLDRVLDVHDDVDSALEALAR